MKYRWPLVGIVLLLSMSVILWIISTVMKNIPITWERALVQIFGISALTLFVVTLVLSAKLRWVEKLFSGFDVMYRYHMYVGITAFLLMMAHFGSVLVMYSDQVLSYLVPTLSITSQYDIAINLGLIAMYGILVLTVLTYISSLPYHIWKSTHQYMGLFFVIGSIHSIVIKQYFGSPDILSVWVGVLSWTGLLTYLYSIFGWKWFGKKYNYTVTSTKHTGIVTHITTTNTGAMFWYPGQFVFATFPLISKESHPYTISNVYVDGYIRLSIKQSGDDTRKLVALKAGDPIILRGPYGSFGEKYLASARPVVMIAGGIGVTPFISMIRHRVFSGKTGAKITLWYCIQNETHAVFKEELEELCEGRDDIEVRYWYSEGKGRIAISDIRKDFTLDPKTLWYVCGPNGLNISMLDQLIESGVKYKQIMIEDFSFKQ